MIYHMQKLNETEFRILYLLSSACELLAPSSVN